MNEAHKHHVQFLEPGEDAPESLESSEEALYFFASAILLVGLVKKNGIMMVDFALTRQRAGLSAEAAILEACQVRLRPIMMTIFAAIFATLPIAIGLGTGGEARRPLGIAVVSGLLFSQLLTLYITRLSTSAWPISRRACRHGTHAVGPVQSASPDLFASARQQA